ncbi:MAG: glucose 1-dehydrogenase [Verrucomicrobia bacterium]|nr:glucose 1-dehydrogenase [Verrucomicrobiota bacterium]
MKAITLTPHTTQVQIKDWPEPQIQNPDEIKTQVLSVGICGTDREEVSGGRADAPLGEKELIIGHEMLSRVVEVGKQVKNFKVGDLAVISVRRECPNCPACNMARSDMCMTGNYTERGIKGRHGFQAEFVVDKEKYAIPVAPEVQKIAVLAEPMSVVQKAIEQAGIIQRARLPYLQNKPNWLEGKCTIVAGLGPIGILAALALRLRGANVVGLDIVDETSPRVKILQEIGGTYFNGKKDDPKEIAQKHPYIDVIFDGAGIAKLDFDLLGMLGINGIFVLTGVPGDQRLINVDGAALMRKLVLKNQVMVGSVNESLENFKMGIADLVAASKKWPGTVDKMITQRYPYKDFAAAFGKHTQDEIKVVIDWT